MTIRIGTAGWAIPREIASRFPEGGSGLARYAGLLDAAEINTSFYRPHRASTYQRWHDSVPDTFRFAVKVRRTITHERRLIGAEQEMAAFLEEVRPLGPKLGPLLVQLPPSLAFDDSAAARFFADLRGMTDTPVACEPRHASWFTPEAASLLSTYRVARVAADPARVPEAAIPGGWPGLVYYRLHGSPRIYRSEYGADRLSALARDLAPASTESWCIFDNTTSGAAARNALTLAGEVASRGG